MREKPWWVWILMICCLGIVKAHLHALRLVILIALGLVGLYMLHLLAGDFQKISSQFRPGGASLLGMLAKMSRGKRSADESTVKQNWIAERIRNDTREMRQVLKHDPIGCARKYVCHISNKSKAKLTNTQNSVLFLLRTFSWLDINGEWKKAEEIGKKKVEGVCEKAYSKCWFSGEQLEKFMNVI